MKKIVLITGLVLVISLNLFSQINITTAVKSSPSIAPLSLDYLQYLNELSSGKRKLTTNSGNGLGEVPSPVKMVFNSFSLLTATISDPSYDLRIAGSGGTSLLTSVKNQGTCGSCWTFATMASIESRWKILGYGVYDLSEDNLNNCSGFLVAPCNGGNISMSAAYLSRKSGPMSEIDDPYNTSPNSCPSGKNEQGYVYDICYLPNTMNTIKQAILDYGALYTNMYWDDPSYNSTNKTYYYGGTASTNHAVTLVGWDNNKVTAGGTGAWIIKNSWGTSWGDNGFFYISYNDTKVNSSVGYFPARLTYNSNTKIYSYDDLGMITSLGYSASTTPAIAYGLIKYVASNDLSLLKIGTWLIEGNTSVEISIYDNFNGTTLSNLLGTVTTQSRTLPGYYTFDLPSAIYVNSGNDFYIKIKYNSVSYYYPIPVEGALTNYANPTIETAKCWVSSNGTGWTGIGTGTSYLYDIGIKAYTSSCVLPEAAGTITGVATVCLGQNLVTYKVAPIVKASSYIWTLPTGATGTSSTDSIVVSYSLSAVSGNIIVKGRNACGDGTASTLAISVKSLPVSGFTINNNSQCLSGNNFGFNNTTTGASSSVWKFGDATATSTITSPSHSYTSVGSYTVKLVSTTTYGCKDSTTRTLDVRPQPVSSFTINNNSQCLSGNNFAITNTTSGASTYKWNFGDATATTTVTSPSHTYTSAGSYTVKLVSTTTYGCKDSTTKTLDVRPKPIPSFTINNNSQCLSGNNFAFTNTATGASTALWSFGDATATTTITSPTHTYSSVGSYTVKLVSTTIYGCKDSTTKTLDVRPQPASSFTINNNSQCLSGNNFAFTNTATGASTALWNFGDATATTTVTSPSHTYTSAGTFTLKLVSTTSYGCKDSTTKSLDVRPQPTAAFTINNNSQCLSGNSFVFTNTASGASTSLWNFGDATATTTVTSPSHTYTSAGTFTVKLLSTTIYGCKDSTTKTLDVRPQPASSFTINNSSQCLSGNSFAFTNTTTGASTYKWTFGDATATSSVTSPSHTYTSAGTFTVKLASTTTYGCKDSTTKTLDVRPQPTAAFTINNNSQCLSGNSFAFTNTSTGASTALWNFGDATATTTVTSPSHTYSSVGTYTVKLVSTTTNGCKDSTTKTLDVRPQPTAAFTINNNSQCLSGNNFVFTNTTTGASTALWNFGDATATTTVTSPSHIYTSAGSYTVKLVSTTTYGCKDSTTKTLDLRPQPVATFTINNNSQCLSGNSFVFTNTATGASTALWNFGDTTATSTTISTTHCYSTADSFIVKLVSATSYGCKDSTTSKLYVRLQPVSSFTINNNSQCLGGNSFSFTNTTTGASSALWNFGEATTTATVTSPSHTYTSADSFIVKLVSTTIYGCKDSTTAKVYVRPQPVTAFAINDTIQCFSKNSFTFTNSSTISSGGWTNNWDFGDTSFLTSSSPTMSYKKSGNYIVKLVTTSGFGCKDSTTKLTYVDPSPTALFSFNADNQCFRGNLFSILNNSSISGGSLNAFWKFGDGDTTTTFTPSHTYLTSDTFQVSLLITSDKFCTDSISRTVIVFPQPKADAILSDTGLCLRGNSFIFTDNSTVNKDTIVLYIWKFGDGNSDTVKNSIHKYATDGNFNLNHIVSTSNGCKDSITKIVSVYPEPKASFTVNDTNQCLNGNLFDYKNTSTISSGKLNYHWDLGDGTTSSNTNNKHSYALVKQYQVWLKVSSLMNCSDSIMHIMYLKANPVVNLGADDSIYGSESIILKADTGFDAYLWSSNSTANQITVDSTRYGLGIKTFWIKVTKNGCDGFDTVLITIFKANSIDDPQANFELKVYPNPVNSTLNLELSPIGKKMTITLNDMNGKELKSIRIMQDNSPSKHQIDVSELAKGVYYLDISYAELRKVVKIMKY